MPPNTKTFPILRRIAAKEATLFFSSPVAYMFLGSFVAVTLFIVFWGEAFFARNIADVRPMFEWMPVLLIVLCSTLTMRMWSEERRTGTLDHVMTQPIPLWVFVLGKFLGCLSLLSIALLITLPLPLTVSLMGDLDWGPVLAGYLATFLLGAAYLAIGLYVSARSQNQIVSLLSAIAVCGLFYLVGTSVITQLVSDSTAELLRQLGAGSRFESITRGMVDLSDLAYYLSLVAAFLALNTFVLEKERWSAAGLETPRHRQWYLVTFLVLANAIALNLWLGQTHAFRIDVTEGNQFSISEPTQKYLAQLQEPLLIRGYFSSKTHPLLAPLVPKLKDLIEEYGVAAGSRVRIEFVDPASNPELEEEAGQDYGIKPMPFQVADRYQSSIVSSYFSILIKYGSEFKVLGFQDLIEVKASSNQDVQVSLRNPEYDLTRAIKKVVDTYQSDGNIFTKVQGKLTLTAYVSDNALLPPKLQLFKKTVQTAAEKAVKDSGDKLTFSMVDPQADGGKVAEKLANDYGLKPMVTDLFSPQQFYFYLILSRGEEQAVQIPIEDGEEATFERNLNAAVKRFASGFTKTVALVTPPSEQPYNPYGGGPPPEDFRELEAFLQNELTVVKEDLSDGTVSSQADILMLAGPKNLDEKAVFAIDQFLMQGGTVVAMTSPYSASFDQGGLKMSEQASGLQEWLETQGVKIDKKLVMDPQNAALPIPVTRNLGGMQVQEVRMLDYPYFVDVRQDGYPTDSPITADLPQVTVAWPSPLSVDTEKMKSRQVVELLRSSAGSWLSASTDIMPLFDSQGNSGFVPLGAQSSHLLALVATGRFDSAFTGKPNPLLAAAPKDAPPSGAPKAAGIIERSPESARIIVIASNDMLKDSVLRLQAGGTGGAYMNTLQMMANAIDWAMEDASLLGIRARGNFNRTLPPMEQKSQMFWEGLNYFFAALALLLVAVARKFHDNRRLAAYQDLAAE
jgi:ABC-2 type transport system permease protein